MWPTSCLFRKLLWLAFPRFDMVIGEHDEEGTINAEQLVRGVSRLKGAARTLSGCWFRAGDKKKRTLALSILNHSFMMFYTWGGTCTQKKIYWPILVRTNQSYYIILFYCPVYGLYTSQGVADLGGDLIGMTGTVPSHVAHVITWEEHGHAHLISRSEEIAAEVAGTVPRLHCWVVVVGALWLQFFLFTMIYIYILYKLYIDYVFLKAKLLTWLRKIIPPTLGSTWAPAHLGGLEMVNLCESGDWNQHPVENTLTLAETDSRHVWYAVIPQSEGSAAMGFHFWTKMNKPIKA